ncbi:MAG: Gfo/Idh/MocA family oxidoreductase [Roseiflexaceae bacterium]|nr:Gfo/Idh/MocA family oxidoreductase [Roseiflexaceae bacterium]
MIQKDARLLRIGVLGAGPIAQSAHFDATSKARNAELYAICDAAEDLLAQVAAIHQPRATYTNYDQMLADPQIEAVVIGVADQFHVPLARRAISAGKHVLVEKPLGVTIEECEELCDDVRASGLVLQVGNNKRFDPGIAFAQQFIREQIGQLLGLKAWYYDSAYRYTMTDNLQPFPRTSANIQRPTGNPKAEKQRYYMLTHGSHLVDTARFLGGEIVQVQARYISKFDSSCWFVAVDFADGSVGHLDLIVPIRGDFEEGFQVFGAGGSVTGRAYLPWYHKASHVECFSDADRQYHRVLGEDGYTYKRQIEGFAETILHGAAQQGATAEDGLAAMRVMVAIARSSETGERVRIADVTGGV